MTKSKWAGAQLAMSVTEGGVDADTGEIFFALGGQRFVTTPAGIEELMTNLLDLGTKWTAVQKGDSGAVFTRDVMATDGSRDRDTGWLVLHVLAAEGGSYAFRFSPETEAQLRAGLQVMPPPNPETQGTA